MREQDRLQLIHTAALLDRIVDAGVLSVPIHAQLTAHSQYLREIADREKPIRPYAMEYWH